MKEQNIAIIGGGIMGLSAAYTLSKRGHSITLYDPNGFPAQNASMIAGGMLAPYAEIEHMSRDWIKAGLAGIDFWSTFSKTHNIGFRQNGSLLIAHDQDQYTLERFKNNLPANGSSKALNAQDIGEIEPALKNRFTKGISLPQEAHLEPAQTLKALCKALKNLGVTLIEEATEPNEIKEQYDVALDCRGMSAAQYDPELRGVKGEIITVRNPDFSLNRPIRMMHPRYPLYIVPRDNHTFMIGATMIETADDTHLSVRSSLELLSALYSLHPSFGDAKVLETHAGIRPSYPDNLPRISQAGNIIHCNGLFRHGYLLAPVMAETLADHLEKCDNSFKPLFLNQGDSNADHTDIERAA